MPLVRPAALAASLSPERSHLEPWRVWPDLFLPADSLWPGHIPAQEARWPAVGKRDMSGPISASKSSAVRLSTPGIVLSSSRCFAKGAITSSMRSDKAAIDSSRKSMCARIWETISAWFGVKRPWSASRSAGSFARSLPRARSASSSGSCVPETSASSIRRPETPSTLEATEESLIPPSCRVFSKRWTSRVRSSICALRYRVKSRSSRISLGGTKLGRTSPCSTSWQIHSASFTSVLRPGTLRRCWAFKSQHSM